MWIVIIYACFVGNVCAFIDSPPVYSQADCKEMMQEADTLLNNDPRVVVFDSKCLHIKMAQG